MDLPYLYRAVTNRCLNAIRDAGTRARLLAAAADELAPAPRTRCDDVAIGADLLVRLGDALDTGHMEVLVARYVDDLTQDEIGAQLGLSRKTVGKRLARIRDQVVALTRGPR